MGSTWWVLNRGVYTLSCVLVRSAWPLYSEETAGEQGQSRESSSYFKKSRWWMIVATQGGEKCLNFGWQDWRTRREMREIKVRIVPRFGPQQLEERSYHWFPRRGRLQERVWRGLSLGRAMVSMPARRPSGDELTNAHCRGAWGNSPECPLFEPEMLFFKSPFFP